jgi:hypothetical protein
MTLRSKLIRAVLSCSLLVGVVAGCDAFNALLKLGDCNAGYLTANEILALNTSARDFLASQSPPTTIEVMTPAQSQAVATFLESNQAQCLEEILNLLEQDPSSLQGLAELAAAFEGTSSQFDPNTATRDDIEGIFNQVFTGATGGNPNGNSNGNGNGNDDDDDNGNGNDNDDDDDNDNGNNNDNGG